jgi:hypothetical protein
VDRYYPYRRDGWQQNYDDFHFTTLLWNTYAIYHEYYSLQKNMVWSTFCEELAAELWAKA